MDVKAIGSKIRQQRKIKGLTQEDLAQKSGLSVMSIRRYESGERIATENVLRRIAKELNIELFELLADDIRMKFPNVPKYLSSEYKSEQDLAHNIEGILANNALNVEYYEKLHDASASADEVIVDKLKYISDSSLRKILLTSFDSLNKRGKYEAVERISELEWNARYCKEMLKNGETSPEDSGTNGKSNAPEQSPEH